MRPFALCVLLSFVCATGFAAENLIRNGDFEQGLAGWGDLWTRTPGGAVALDAGRRHAGANSAHIRHTGSKDWSFHWSPPLPVEPGQIFELDAWVRVEGEGDATLCVTLRDPKGEVLDWTFGDRSTRATPDWRPLRSRFIIPPGASSIQPRLIGDRPAEVWLDDVRLSLAGTLDQLRSKDLPETLRASSPRLDMTLHVADGALSIVDRRTGRRWQQKAQHRAVVLDAKAADGGFDLDLLDPTSTAPLSVAVRLDRERPELCVELSGSGEMPRAIAFPPPFATGKGTFLVMPVNEGISYPVDDETLDPMHYHLYGGHGLCMAFYGVTDGEQGLLTIVETPDDAAVRVPRSDGLLCLAPEWLPQKGQFGPKRRLRYVFLDGGGYVAMCKRYREYARQAGLLKTLAEKRKENQNVDLLVGAVNVWCWDQDAVAICREMQSLGIDRILWSNRCKPETITQLNGYDIYQDVMNPANFPKLHGVHSDWTTEAWPDDLVIMADGQWERGWRVRGKDGQWYPCGVLCDRLAVDYARRRIPPELETHPYRCRFIDTTTASPWRECYAPKHPMTRTESRHWKMELLRFVGETSKLVTGSETGHDAAVPFVHYFEGMLSLGPYRVPDSGRNMIEFVRDVPERVAKFQTGHYYRLPLWELVYHDCVVAQWYWGDYNNKLPSLWDRRDLFNLLYGTPPMFMFNRKIWAENRDRFAKSYKTAAPVARAAGYAEMLSHRWLTDDHAVQETRFAGGVVVVVNFGDKPYKPADGTEIPPLGFRVEGVKAGRPTASTNESVSEAVREVSNPPLVG